MGYDVLTAKNNLVTALNKELLIYGKQYEKDFNNAVLYEQMKQVVLNKTIFLSCHKNLGYYLHKK